MKKWVWLQTSWEAPGVGRNHSDSQVSNLGTQVEGPSLETGTHTRRFAAKGGQLTKVLCSLSDIPEGLNEAQFIFSIQYGEMVSFNANKELNSPGCAAPRVHVCARPGGEKEKQWLWDLCSFICPSILISARS